MSKWQCSEAQALRVHAEFVFGEHGRHVADMRAAITTAIGPEVDALRAELVTAKASRDTAWLHGGEVARERDAAVARAEEAERRAEVDALREQVEELDADRWGLDGVTRDLYQSTGYEVQGASARKLAEVLRDQRDAAVARAEKAEELALALHDAIGRFCCGIHLRLPEAQAVAAIRARREGGE